MTTKQKRSVGDIPGLELHLSPTLVKWIGFFCLCLGSFSTAVIQQGILGLGAGNWDLDTIGQSASLTAWANAAVICTGISYLAIPIYARLVYEGSCRSSNPRAYFLRLVLAALLAEIPYDLSTAGVCFNWSSQNPTWALAIGALMLSIFREYAQPGPRGSILQCLVLAMAVAWTLVLRSEFGILTVLLIAVFAIFSQKKLLASLGGGLMCFLQFPAPLGMFVAHWYDGSKAKPRKHLFYLLYLAQLAVFAALAVILS